MPATHPDPASPSFADLLERSIAADATGARAPAAGDDGGRIPDGTPTWSWIQGLAGPSLTGAAWRRDARGPGERAGAGTSAPADPPPPAVDLGGLPAPQQRAFGFFHAQGETRLSPASGHDALRRAYRRLARRLHPDVRGAAGDATAFLELRRHYETLLSRDAA